MSLYAAWIAAKEMERAATEKRREIEDKLFQQFGISEQLDGTENFEIEGFKIKITGRMTRKVDSEKLQELAAEAGVSEHLGSLFRWKPEVDAKAWKAADSSITAPLLGAITTTPGRASFTITKE